MPTCAERLGCNESWDRPCPCKAHNVMEKVDFNNWDTCDKLYSRDSKKTVRAFQSKAQFILPVDLGECNTQTDPKKEEAEGTA